MGTTKERLEDLETGLGLVQDELQKLSTGMNDKFQGMETRYQNMESNLKTSMERILELLAQNRSGESSTPAVTQVPQPNPPSITLDATTQLPVPLAPPIPQPEHNPRPATYPPHVGPPPPPLHPPHYPPLNPQPQRHIKLNFPRFNGGDPTEWLSKSKQYFAYQGVPRAQQVSFASYHLTEEANEWWLATSKALDIDPNNSPWETFEEELWNRFGPTEGENFHEALSKIQQTGTLREYQRDFERLMNKVDNWSEKALVRSYLGGLHTSIADHIRMFAPTTLKSVINLARLRDDQLQRQRRSSSNHNTASGTNQNGPSAVRHQPSQAPKRLSWDDMKRKRSLGLCFSCDERYTPGHMCKTSQLLLMIGEDEDEEDDDLFHDNGEIESFKKLNLGDKIHLGEGSNDRVAEPNRHSSNQTKFPNQKYTT